MTRVPRPCHSGTATLWRVVGEPESDDDFDDAVRRFMDALATTDPADAPREPSYADRVRAARQADLQDSVPQLDE